MLGRLGLLGILGGIVVLVVGNVVDDVVVASVGFGMIMLGIILRVARVITFRPWKSKLLHSGVEGTAEVLRVRDTNATAGQNAQFRLGLLVTVADREPYEAEATIWVSRTQFGVLQPGIELPVRVDPDKPDRVVIDTVRASDLAPQGGASSNPMVAGRSISATFSAADIVAQGVATTGVLGTITPTGKTAGQVVKNLPPHEADDPLVTMSFTYLGPGAETMHKEALARVPDGKAALLVTGNEIPVSYLPDRPDVATIDWDRL